MELVSIYSYDIDFQRDIRDGDNFQVLYEILVDKNSKTIMNGDILYANMIIFKQENPVYYYTNLKGEGNYYDSEGHSVKKSLMKTPINGARLSSGFGRRMHPILGFTKFHKGVDFAARKGTPVLAAGDGIIERSNRYGGYGKYIRIRHNSDYKTAYAHLHKFSRGISRGKRVKQGSVIGFVGSTGRSTGPHLHYEIIFRGKQINPRTLQLPKGTKIVEEEMENYERLKLSIIQILSNKE